MDPLRRKDSLASSSTDADAPTPASTEEGAWQAVGSHRMRIQGDLIEWEGIGPVRIADIRAYQDLRDTVLARLGYCVALVNSQATAGINPDARRFLAEQARSHVQRRVSTAVYGVSGPAYAMAALVIRAMELLGRRKNQILICSNEAEARAWLETQRRLYQATSAAQTG
jgi:hypothetical protein